MTLEQLAKSLEASCAASCRCPDCREMRAAAAFVREAARWREAFPGLSGIPTEEADAALKECDE